ncbi:MAG: non-ribosomal peptide synthetase, partial [Caedimonadaceae bacterium]
YNAYCTHQPSPFSSLPLQYADFAIWQRDWLQGDALKQQLSYWKQQLSNIPDLLELPTDKARPKELTYHGATHSHSLSKEVKEALNQLAQRHNTSLFMILLTAFQVLLYRYTGQKDIVVGSPIANRHHKETEDLIGFFVNTLALRTIFEGYENFLDLLGKVKETTLQAHQHQDVPFEQLVDHLNITRALNRNPVFQIMFTFQNMDHISFPFKGLVIDSLSTPNPVAKFDVSFSTYEQENGIGISIEYATDLFE